MYCACRAGTTCIVHAELVQYVLYMLNGAQHVLYMPSRYTTCILHAEPVQNMYLHAELVQHVLYITNCPVSLPIVE